MESEMHGEKLRKLFLMDDTLSHTGVYQT